MRGWGVKKGWERGICGSEREPGITMKLMCESMKGSDESDERYGLSTRVMGECGEKGNKQKRRHEREGMGECETTSVRVGEPK